MFFFSLAASLPPFAENKNLCNFIDFEWELRKKKSTETGRWTKQGPPWCDVTCPTFVR